MDPMQLVRSSYDWIAETYAEWSSGLTDPIRDELDALLIETFISGTRLLDLGCGNGLPSLARLSRHFSVVGVDSSGRQLELAGNNVPGVHLIHSEMTEVNFQSASFSAVVAHYSIIHVPREHHSELFRKVHEWLESGGWFVCSLGAGGVEAGYEEDWLGAPMYWSNHDAATSKSMLEAAGFEVIRDEIVALDEDGVLVEFAWFVARKR